MRVGSMVRHMVGGCSGFVHGSRLKLFVRMVEAVLRGRRLVPATVGRHVEGPEPKHGIKCADRFLGNNGMWRERDHLFRALCARLLDGCPHPVVLVDWTQLQGGKHEALVATTPIGGRSLPLYLEVHPLEKLGNATVEDQFLRSLSEILPEGCNPVIVSDAGFKRPFFASVQALGWDFVGRVRGTAKALSTGFAEVITKEEFYARATVTPRDLGRFHLFVGNPLDCRLVIVRKHRKPGPKKPPPRCKEERELRQSALDPWLLATSLTSGNAAYIVSLYARRMQIEETFRDAKNHRFGWCLSDARTSTHQRTTMLLLLAAFAITLVTLIGLRAESAGAHRAYQANTARQRVLSFFVLGCAMLERSDHRFVSLAGLKATLRLIGGLSSA